MPARDKAPVGAPCWVDLMTSDVERSRAFYAELLGWTAGEPSAEFGGYFMFTRGDIPMAGGMGNQPDFNTPDRWTIYLATPDAKHTCEEAVANGGLVLVEPMAVADLGTMAMIADPGGAAIGMWEPDTFQGIGVLAEPGTPSWFELHTRDYDTVIPFYEKVFGWRTSVVSDTPEFRYTTLGSGTEMAAGIADGSPFLPEGVPASWSVYFGVDDTDAALAEIGRLGGSTLRPAEDTPYGRLATAADPTGALFKLVAPNEAMPAREA